VLTIDNTQIFIVMAFIRKEIKKSGTYLRFVESYRDQQGVSRHRTLFNLGRADSYSPESLKKMGQVLYELGGGTLQELEFRQLKEKERYNYGFPIVVEKLLKEYRLDDLLQRRIANNGLEYNLADSVRLLICERLHDPVSKHATFNNQKDYLGLSRIELHQIYRTLDQLYEIQESLKYTIYQRGRDLFNQKLDIVFYDLTTFYFDSDNEDDFREKGYGKDGKIGKTIIVFGMLIDQNKQPVGYEVYHGRQYEGHTFTDILKRLKNKYQIEKIICVADSGLMNNENLLATQSHGYEYIIGERLKSISKAKQDEILDLGKYQKLTVEDHYTDESVEIKYYITDYKNKKLITTYSKNRAARDKALREQKIEKAMMLLQNPSTIDKKATIHYLNKHNDCTYYLDEQKIQNDQRFDGFLTIATNNTSMSTVQILDAHKQLYKIEQSFRSFKTFLETRPMYHWTKKRILGHLALCYISFTLLNHLQLRLKQNKTPLSEDQIRRALVKVQLSKISQNNMEYFLRSNTPQDAQLIMKTLKIKQMPDLIPAPSISTYI
jgi:transposase